MTDSKFLPTLFLSVTNVIKSTICKICTNKMLNSLFTTDWQTTKRNVAPPTPIDKPLQHGTYSLGQLGSSANTFIRCLCVSPSGRWAACGLASGHVVALDARTAMPLAQWRAHDSEVSHKHDKPYYIAHT